MKLLPKRKKLKKNSSKKKVSTSKQTFRRCSKVKNFLKSSNQKHAPFSRPQLPPRLKQSRSNLSRSYQEALVEEVVAIKEELGERVDSYLEYVADEWFQENALAVESGLKSEITESFLDGMKGLFEEHYVTIPEEKYDVLESMVDKLDEMEGKLNEQIERNVSLNRRLAESSADGIFAAVAEGLADTQKEKLASLAENVEFESEADYREADYPEKFLLPRVRIHSKHL